MIYCLLSSLPVATELVTKPVLVCFGQTDAWTDGWMSPPSRRVGFSGGSDGKESACEVGDLDLFPGSGRSPGERNATPSAILAWEISWTEEPGGLYSVV